MSIWLDIANALYLVSYLVTDILWLRGLTILGGLASLAWALTQPMQMTALIAWGAVFMVINVAQIARLLHERRPVRLAPDEQQLYARVFRALTPREFRRLLAIGRWEDAPAGAVLIEQGAPPDRVLVLAAGRVAVKASGRAVATLDEGRFVGEMGFLTGRPTSAAIEALEPLRYVAFPAAPLRAFLAKNAPLRSALQLLIGQDLVAKIASEGR